MRSILSVLMPKCITVGMVPTVSAALLLAGLPSGAEAASAARPSDALAGLVVSGPVEAVEPTELERPDAPSVRDYVHFARRNGGRTFYLYVRRSTHLSEPLKEAIGRKDVRVRYIWG